MFKKIKKWVGYSLVFFFTSTIATALIYRYVPVPLTPYMIIRAFETRSLTFKKKWVPFEKISEKLSFAVISSEDQMFLEHFGFDIQAIQKAIKFNKTHKRKKGASTISQQTAKNVFLWPGRNWFRKSLEVYFTTLIEVCWSKQRIIEVYLNVIEMGKGVYGAQAASKYYFNKNASDLNSYDAAFIAALLPKPTSADVKNPSNYIKKRQRWIVNQMNHLDKKEYDELFEEEQESDE